jgi:hypothetical protein
MPVMTEEEIKQTVNSMRRILQSLTPYTTEAMQICLLTAATFSMDRTPDRQASAARLELAFTPVIDGVRHGGLEMRTLDS